MSASSTSSTDALAQQEEHVQQELAELILQVQSKNHSLFTETLHRFGETKKKTETQIIFSLFFSFCSFEQSRQLDKVRLQELDTENATLRAQVDKLMQRVHQLPPSQSDHATNTTTSASSSTGSSAVASSDLHALQTRLAGVKEQLGALQESVHI
jgi:hypothetical protein